MNSYGFDQPLDLRLKALNLSRNFAQDLPASGGIVGDGLAPVSYQLAAVGHHIHRPSVMVGAQPVNIMVNNLVLASAYTANGNSATQISANTMTNCGGPMTGGHMVHLSRSRRQYNHHPQQQHHLYPQPQAAHSTEDGRLPTGVHHERQAQMLLMANDSAPITQTLAHHQAQLEQQQQQPDLASPTSNQSTTNDSYCQASTKQRRLSPPLQQRVVQPSWPVRSLSMSGQMLNPSHLSLMVSPASTPPTSAPSYYPNSSNLHHHHNQLPNITSGVQTPPTYRHQTPPMPIKTASCATSPQGSQRSPDSPLLLISSNSNSNSTLNTNSSSPAMAASSPNKPNACNKSTTTNASNTISGLDWNSISRSYKDATDLSSSSPPTALNSSGGASTSALASELTPAIVRQQSLVGRYNCKPCGIVFSQPETLRAHQEGYCTKTNRRSQSAVSPSTIEQQQTLTAQPGK